MKKTPMLFERIWENENVAGITDQVIPGMEAVKCERSFEGIREFIVNHNVEGLVFWKDGEPKCKIRYHDFFPEK